MKNYFKVTVSQLDRLLIISIIIVATMFASCADENYYASHEPEWLGANIYDYLKTDKHYTNYVKLIDDLGYTETFSKTGSVTLFAATDSAFDVFYKKNDWGVRNYEQLTLAQKKLIMNFGMLNNAYTSDYLPNYFDVSLQTGAAMRRNTRISIYDSIPHEYGGQLPLNPYFEKYRARGIHMLKDNTLWPIVQFTQKQMDQVLITDDDFNFITGSTRTKDDIHIFGDKVVKRDVTCKNGYIDVLDKVLIPPMNMAQYIKSNPNTQIFSKLLDRFCAPYLSKGNTLAYSQLQQAHPELPAIDSIFVLRYFSSVGGATRYPGSDGTDLTGANINPELLLPFDPGWNSYRNGTNAVQTDMGAMFVPSDAAMTEYFNNGVLKDYGTWENVPDKIIMSFLQRHMRVSLISSVPSRFSKMMDGLNSQLPVQRGDITPGNVYLGVNGAVYITNRVYAPDEYSSVYAPVLFGKNTKVFDWFIKNYENGVFLYKYYLLSLVNKYSFFVPTDDVFTKYIDPVAYSTTVPAAIKFWYNTKTSAVNATIYKYDKTTNVTGDSVAIITEAAFIKNRILDIIEAHIVVGGVESGNKYYLSKGNNVIKVLGSGNSMTVEGGGDMAMGTISNVTNAFTQSNGFTYYIDKPIQTPLASVYKVLGAHDEFSEFYKLLSGQFPAGSEIFTAVKGMDQNVKFLNTYNYTVYVPTNAAILKAIQDGLIMSWETINALPTDNATQVTHKNNEISKLSKFLRYHFQDNSVFVDGKMINGQLYPTATKKNDNIPSAFGTSKDKFYQLKLTVNGTVVTLTTENGKTANVVTGNNLYNLMARDFLFNDKPLVFKSVDGSVSAAKAFSASTIETSATAVIHQIDNVLTFQ
jgi:uncharacterized surface protein with fasciclin (FAS1) repeats